METPRCNSEVARSPGRGAGLRCPRPNPASRFLVLRPARPRRTASAVRSAMQTGRQRTHTGLSFPGGAQHWPRTLASVQFADEIMILDSSSTDRTVEIARAFNAKVYDEAWKGFSASKNSAIEKCTGTWILSLDADEELSPKLQDQIRTLLPTNPPTDAYYIKRRNLFLGRWIKHGGFYPDPKLRLFRRAAANFTRRRSSRTAPSTRPSPSTAKPPRSTTTSSTTRIRRWKPTSSTWIATARSAARCSSPPARLAARCLRSSATSSSSRS